MAPVTVAPEALEKFVIDLFVADGVAADRAEAMAKAFVWASLRGVDTHGISRVPAYLGFFESGIAVRDAELEVHSPKAAVARIDANRAPGPVALTAAADLAVSKARELGVGWVGVGTTVHVGALGYYVSRIAEQGLIGVGIVAGMPNMAYEGAIGAAVATSPLAVAIPGTGKHPTVLLDMASSVIAFGKIGAAKKAGKQLPENSAVSEDGVITTDPEIAKYPLPLGGAKGSGLSLVFEMLSSVLVGAPILAGFHDGTGKKHKQSGVLIALDPAAFTDAAEFASDVDATVDAIHGLKTAPGVERVRVPGEGSSAIAAARTEKGVPVNPNLWTELSEAAAARGVELPAHTA